MIRWPNIADNANCPASDTRVPYVALAFLASVFSYASAFAIADGINGGTTPLSVTGGTAVNLTILANHSGCTVLENGTERWMQLTHTSDPLSASGTYVIGKNFSATTPVLTGARTYDLEYSADYDCGGGTFRWNGTVSLTVTVASSSPADTGRSVSAVALERAENLFKDPALRENLKIRLSEARGFSDELYFFSWDGVGSEQFILYELEASNNADFLGAKSFGAFGTQKFLFENDLPTGDVRYFRLRAAYEGKHSPWSNTVSVTNKTNFLRFFTVKFKKYGLKTRFFDALGR